MDLRDLTRQVGPGGAAERPGPGVDVEVLRKDVLPEWPDGWLIGTRKWFRQIRLHALDALCDRYRDDGRLDAALDAGITAVAADPLRESAHRRLTLVHIEEGTSPRRCASTTSTADYCAPSSGCLRRSTSASSSRRCSAGPGRGPRCGAAVSERLNRREPFTQVKSTEGGRRQQAVDELPVLLAAHETAEKQDEFPLVRAREADSPWAAGRFSFGASGKAARS